MATFNKYNHLYENQCCHYFPEPSALRFLCVVGITQVE